MITFDKKTKTFFLDGKGVTYAFFINHADFNVAPFLRACPRRYFSD